MIEEEGKIVETQTGIAMIRAEKTSGCDKCLSKKSCKSISDTDMLVEARNPINAKTGDHVVFTVGAGTVLKAGVLVYLFPLLAFIAGVLIGQVIGDQVLMGNELTSKSRDLMSAILGFIFTAVTYVAVSIYSKRARKDNKNMATIVRVI